MKLINLIRKFTVKSIKKSAFLVRKALKNISNTINIAYLWITDKCQILTIPYVYIKKTYTFLKKTFNKHLKKIIFLGLTSIVIFVLINAYILFSTKDFIFDDIDDVPKAYVAIVLGARVMPNGFPSYVLQDRLDTAIDLYNFNKVERILLSGDHGQNEYDEVNNMKKYLISKNIPVSDIFLDHAGFNTYNSMSRAKEIFLIDDAIVVSQKFHLARSVYIAREKGISAVGIVANRRFYLSTTRNNIRESLARVKSFFEVLINVDPKFLGDQIPITGDSNLSFD